MAKFRYQHILSKVPNKRPNITGEGALKDGEIAVQIADEKLLVKNLDEDGLIEFSSDNKLDEKYYTKSQTSGATELADEFTKYYTKSQTSGATELAEAFANVEIDVDQVINEATSGSSGAVATKAVYSFVTDELDGINDEIDEKLGTGFTVSSVTEVINENERITAEALNYLNTTVIDNERVTAEALNYLNTNKQNVLSAGTGIVIEGNVISSNAVVDVDPSLSPTSNNPVANSAITNAINSKANSSDVYLKSETSGATEISNALALKANSSDVYTKSQTSGATELATAFANVQIDIDQVIDSGTSASTGAVATSAVYGFVTTELQNNYYTKEEVDDGDEVISASLNDLNTRKLDASAYTPTDLSNYYTKSETSGASEISNALALKADNSVMALTFGGVEYDSNLKRINFYNDAEKTSEVLGYVDATAFIKDGMVDNVEIKTIQSGDPSVSVEVLAITFNSDAGKEEIDIPLEDIFNPDNYYTKSETSGATELSSEFAKYYTKNETSGATELAEAFANVEIDVDQVIDETTSGSSGAVATSAVFDFVTDELDGINDEIDEKLGTGFTVSSVTEVIEDIEKAISASLNDLNTRKLDASAYTPTDLSNYYTKDETSGATELSTEFAKYYTKSETSGASEIATEFAKYYTTGETSGATEIATALSLKADANDIVDFFDDAKYEMSGTTPVLNFYNGNTIKSTIDASDFIVDGMIDDVELVASGDTTALVITWNTDGGSKVITLDVGDIFEADNYYTKSQTSGATELADAFANVHINVDQVIDETTSGSSGAVATSAVFDFVIDTLDGIDDEIDERLGTAFTTSSVTEYVQDIELAISASLNDLDERIIDHSSNTAIHLLQVVSAVTVSADMYNVTCPDEIIGASNNGAQALIVYENSGDTDDYTITVSTSYKTPDGNQLLLTCPANGYCEVSYVNINGRIYVRGI